MKNMGFRYCVAGYAALALLALLVAAITTVHEIQEQIGSPRHDPSLFEEPAKATEGFGHLADQIRETNQRLVEAPDRLADEIHELSRKFDDFRVEGG